MAIVDKVKQLWGSQQSSAFKLAAWALAGGIALVAYEYSKPKQDEFDDAESWNKKILDKNKK
ncbi:hypothetical protein H310_14511 [Aphanomyces invadans]|uniref:Uncharacterized protein n=1 Tax=Aphanomyces invadans TaxID=157072 RepID=A0A024T9F5_9STRA|nr:hypothetical protein H310_14511 [Aphanomyces invadans]ETV90775.1 hypothetical protein H310_14511 [Aphanomyces invadans]|eukprot:XP_008880611.1 hypothetical protein H310_14511 [Aphanomyces invadans]